MNAEVVLPVRIRINGVRDFDEAQAYARNIIEKGTRAEGDVGLPMGVELVGVECGGTSEVTVRNRA